GSAKTRIGKNLAKMKNYTFVDTDELIEQQQQRSINEIFAADGEQAFRDMETELLRQLIAERREHMVISTGGGMPLRAENRQLLSHLGKVVFLKASPRTIYDRIRGDTTRPLLQCANPMGRIEEMIAARTPLYEEGAAIVVDVNALRQSEATQEILRRC
ncbi:MAG: shikimate kinase, partial [Lachnospiraceae bacterium]|nr:shikimate kinase [Lachnospiraceae bacterium]